MRHAVMPARLEQVAEAHEVRLHVGAGIFERIPDARLRRHVDDAVEALGGEQCAQYRAVGDVDLREAELRMRLELAEPRALERRVVVVVEVVDADHLVTARQQGRGDVHADEARRAGDQDLHATEATARPRPIGR
jgi:hypothetical protein